MNEIFFEVLRSIFIQNFNWTTVTFLTAYLFHVFDDSRVLGCYLHDFLGDEFTFFFWQFKEKDLADLKFLTPLKMIWDKSKIIFFLCVCLFGIGLPIMMCHWYYHMSKIYKNYLYKKV